jgi:hypothetical protein
MASRSPHKALDFQGKWQLPSGEPSNESGVSAMGPTGMVVLCWKERHGGPLLEGTLMFLPRCGPQPDMTGHIWGCLPSTKEVEVEKHRRTEHRSEREKTEQTHSRDMGPGLT